MSQRVARNASRAARPAPAELRASLQSVIAQRGLRGAADDLLVSDRTLARVAAGAEVRDGTIELLRQRLRELAADERAREDGPTLRLVPHDSGQGADLT